MIPPSATKVIRWDTENPTNVKKIPTDPSWTTEEVECWKRLIWCQSHLQTVAYITNIMSFFAMTAAVELPLREGMASKPLLITYVSTTCLLVGVTIIAKIGSTTLLPNLEAVSGMDSISEVFSSPHDQLFDQISVICFLGHIVAPLLFCLDLILITWIKFAHFSFEAVLAATAILVPVQGFILVLGRILIRRIQKYKEHYRLYLRLGPTRRYSEIALTWDQSEDEEERDNGVSSSSEDTSLLRSYHSHTSYGAIISSDMMELAHCKVMVDMH